MNIRTSAFRGLAILSLTALGLAACEGKDVINIPEPTPPAVEVVVAPTQVTLAVGQKAALAAVVKNATTQTVTWACAPAGVVTLAGTEITATAPGSAICTATATADANAKGVVSVTVTPAVITMSVLPTTATLVKGGTINLTATVSGSSNQNVTWTSSAATVADVATACKTANSNPCTVTSAAAGTAVITATSAADPNVRASSVITVTEVVSNVGITLQPATATTTISGTVQMVAIVTGSTNTGAKFRSSTPAVASVDSAGGLVTGNAAGTAVITAIALGDTTKKATAVITVAGAPPEPSISIASIVYNPSGNPVIPDSIAGQVDATVNISAVPENDVRAVVLFIDNVEVCRQNFATPLGTTQGVATINCPVNTAQLNTNGTPVFPNGLHTFYARAFNGAGTPVVIAEAQFCPVQPVPGQPCVVNFRNVNSVGVVVTPLPPTAADTLGRQWYQAFDAVVTPSIFTLQPGTTTPDVPLTVTATAYRWNGGAPVAIRTETVGAVGSPAPTGKITFNFSAAELAGVEDSVFVQATVATVGALTLNNTFGNNNVTFPPSPVNFSNPALWVRIDNKAPTISAMAAFPNAYINDAVTFALTAAQTFDGGVDREDAAGNIVFDIVDAATAAVIGTCTNVTNATCAPESATNQAYLLRITIKDALGNTATYYTGTNGVIYTSRSTAVSGGASFGVDRTAATLTVTASEPSGSTVGDTAVTGDAAPPITLPISLSFSYIDTATPPAGPSGFAANPVRVIMKLYNAANPNGRCVSVNTVPFTLLSATATTAQCTFGVTNPAVIPADAQEGYYVVTAWVVDAAGNTSAQQTFTYLYDITEPTAGNLVVPSVVTGGSSFAMTANISDNVELGDVRSTIIYSGGPYALVQATDVIGTYGVPLVAAELSQDHTVTANYFIRSITVVDAAGKPVVGYANTFTPVTAEFAVRDVAGIQLEDLCPPLGVVDASTQNCLVRRQNIVNAYLQGNTAVNDSTTKWWAFAGFSFAGTGDQITKFVMDTTTNAIDAIVTGPFQTFNNPFPGGVYFYAVDGTGRATQLGLGSVGVTDNTITGVRTWRYTYATAYPVGTTAVFALGLNGTTGDAIVTVTETKTVAPPTP